MPSLTRADLTALGRRAQQPRREANELLAVFVAGKLTNPLNAGWAWEAKSGRRYKREWKERVALVLLEAEWPLRLGRDEPKRVTFLAHTWSAMDGDGLQAALKPCRDALVECGVISGDADRDGHEFVYAQRVDRARRGVEIRVSLRANPERRLAATQGEGQ